MLFCHKVNFTYMKLNNAGKNIWLPAQTENKKLKQNVQIQDAGGMQVFFCVLFDTGRGSFSTIILLVGGTCHPPTLYVSSGAP